MQDCALCTTRVDGNRTGGRPTAGCTCVAPAGTAIPLCRTPQKYKDSGFGFKSCHTLFHEDEVLRKNDEYMALKEEFRQVAKKHDDMQNTVKKLKLSLSKGSSKSKDAKTLRTKASRGVRNVLQEVTKGEVKLNSIPPPMTSDLHKGSTVALHKIMRCSIQASHLVDEYENFKGLNFLEPKKSFTCDNGVDEPENQLVISHAHPCRGGFKDCVLAFRLENGVRKERVMFKMIRKTSSRTREFCQTIKTEKEVT
eukprot:Nk52_evm1s1748 gene=Nk52_evmTU1s1748